MEVEIRNVHPLDLNGGKIWHIKGNRGYYHREDGPARIFGDGREFWWYYNERYSNIKDMPLNLFLAYCKWEYKKNG